MKLSLLTTGLALIAAAHAIAEEDEAAKLAMQLNNPISSLISVPF